MNTDSHGVMILTGKTDKREEIQLSVPYCEQQIPHAKTRA